MKMIEQEVIKSLRQRIEESKRKIKQDEEDLIFQRNVIKESDELIRKIQENEEHNNVQ